MIDMADDTKEETFEEWRAGFDYEEPVYDGLDDCVVGMAARCGKDPLLVYDHGLLVRHFVKEDGMSEEEAVEWIDFNILGGWIGEGTPLILFKRERVPPPPPVCPHVWGAPIQQYDMEIQLCRRHGCKEVRSRIIGKDWGV